MSVLRAVILAAMLSAPVGAPAATIADKASGATVALTLADALLPRRPLLVEDADLSASAAQSYFDYDTMLTLGALALTLGVFAAFARPASPKDDARAQQDPIVRWMQSDLARRIAHRHDAA